MEKYNTSNCLDMQYSLLSGVFFSEKEETDNYIICTSEVISDTYWNMAYLKTNINDNILNEIESKLIEKDRKPCIYIGRYEESFEDNKQFLLDNGYSSQDTDVYMILEKYANIPVTMKMKVVETEEDYNDFMTVLASAYNDNIENASENVYADAITEEYYKAIKNSIGNDKIYNIVGYNEDNVPVSVATVSINNEVGMISNVGTRQGYWNRGYSKQVLMYLTNLFKEKGGKDLLLCTEWNSKNQSYYEKLGFKEIYVMEQYVK